MDFNQQLYAKRQRSNAIGLTLSMGAMVLGLFVLLWILSVLFSNGLAALDWNMFTQSTPAPGSDACQPPQGTAIPHIPGRCSGPEGRASCTRT